ncbi:MAG TPA: hypothetical protein VFN23_10530 [Ktedonobacteraceae bacterium]|nr:hypothetical protein [Ktedonobacteraceae bacterium]
MPRLYLSTTDFLATTEALTFPAQMARLQNVAGALDMLLARASRRVDGFCKKRIGQPGQTTIVVGGGISAGATLISLTSTLGFDNGQEQAILLNPGGGTQEIVLLVPAPVQVSNWSSPYPGSLKLAQGTLYPHSAGEVVQGLYQEVSTVGSSGSSDIYSESLLELNQAAQLARAHAPQFDTSGLTRVIFLKQYPIIALYRIEHMLPIDTTYETLDQSQVGIQPSAGYLRLPIGSFVLPEGLFRSTYTAGFQYASEEVQQATALYAADLLQNMLTFGAAQSQQGKLRLVAGQTTQYKSRYVQAAEEILSQANLVRRT